FLRLYRWVWEYGHERIEAAHYRGHESRDEGRRQTAPRRGPADPCRAQAARREDLAAQERYEIGVIETYLPAQLSDAELDALIAQCIADAGATSPRDMGKVMALLKERATGRADMGALSQRVKAKLAG